MSTGDPVFQRRLRSTREAAAYWMPAFGGMTTVDGHKCPAYSAFSSSSRGIEMTL